MLNEAAAKKTRNGGGPVECVDDYRDLVSQWEEAAPGNEGLEHTEPLVPCFLFFFIAHDSEAPGVGAVEGLDAWAETCGVQALESMVGGRKHVTLSHWPAQTGLDSSLAKCTGGYGDKTETAGWPPSPDNAAK